MTGTASCRVQRRVSEVLLRVSGFANDWSRPPKGSLDQENRSEYAHQ
jgi:hypothetical protein